MKMPKKGRPPVAILVIHRSTLRGSCNNPELTDMGIFAEVHLLWSHHPPSSFSFVADRQLDYKHIDQKKGIDFS